MQALRSAPFFALVLMLTLAGCSKKSQAQNTQPAAAQQTVDALRAKAEKGDAEAQYQLGYKYRNGDGCQKDPLEALKWYRLAADNGHSDAQVGIGLMYMLGEGVVVNPIEANQWFRKSAELGNVAAQFNLAVNYSRGIGVPKDEMEAVNLFQKAAEQGLDSAQYELGELYRTHKSVPNSEELAHKWLLAAAQQGHVDAQYKMGQIEMYYPPDSAGEITVKNPTEAMKWFLKAASHGHAESQEALGFIYDIGMGVPKDQAQAVKWFRSAAELGYHSAQYNLGASYSNGSGVPRDEVEAYKWWLIAAAQGNGFARKAANELEALLTPSQRAEGQRLAREFTPRKPTSAGSPISRSDVAESRPESTGSGFFITDDGYLITNQHVADEGAAVRVLTGNGAIPAKVVKVDRANDIALLKVEGKFVPLAIASSRGVRLGSTAATVGFPNVGLQGYSPKLAKGEIASLAGIQDDARHFQISVPVQPGNSGGALVDERGNVIGVVVAKLSQNAAIATTGTLAENVSYAVKSSYLLSFLESVPDVAAKLKEPSTRDRKFEDVIHDAEQAAVLVLVY